DVALCEVDFDDRPVSTLPERISCYRSKSGLDRLGEVAGPQERPTQRLQDVYAQLVEALALDDRPVVVPVRQQIGGEGIQVHLAKVDHHRIGEKATSQRADRRGVALDIGPECDMRPGRVDDLVAELANTPDRAP